MSNITELYNKRVVTHKGDPVPVLDSQVAYAGNLHAYTATDTEKFWRLTLFVDGERWAQHTDCPKDVLRLVPNAKGEWLLMNGGQDVTHDYARKWNKKLAHEVSDGVEYLKDPPMDKLRPVNPPVATTETPTETVTTGWSPPVYSDEMIKARAHVRVEFADCVGKDGCVVSVKRLHAFLHRGNDWAGWWDRAKRHHKLKEGADYTCVDASAKRPEYVLTRAKAASLSSYARAVVRKGQTHDPAVWHKAAADFFHGEELKEWRSARKAPDAVDNHQPLAPAPTDELPEDPSTTPKPPINFIVTETVGFHIDNPNATIKVNVVDEPPADDDVIPGHKDAVNDGTLTESSAAPIPAVDAVDVQLDQILDEAQDADPVFTKEPIVVDVSERLAEQMRSAHPELTVPTESLYDPAKFGVPTVAVEPPTDYPPALEANLPPVQVISHGERFASQELTPPPGLPPLDLSDSRSMIQYIRTVIDGWESADEGRLMAVDCWKQASEQAKEQVSVITSLMALSESQRAEISALKDTITLWIAKVEAPHMCVTLSQFATETMSTLGMTSPVLFRYLRDTKVLGKGEATNRYKTNIVLEPYIGQGWFQYSTLPIPMTVKDPATGEPQGFVNVSVSTPMLTRDIKDKGGEVTKQGGYGWLLGKITKDPRGALYRLAARDGGSTGRWELLYGCRLMRVNSVEGLTPAIRKPKQPVVVDGQPNKPRTDEDNNVASTIQFMVSGNGTIFDVCRYARDEFLRGRGPSLEEALENLLAKTPADTPKVVLKEIACDV